MKDITLKITGKQVYSDKEEDQVEFITDGKLYERGGAYYVVYEESDESGFGGYKTTIKLAGDCVKMRRTGTPGVGAELCFEKGRRMSSVYNTPYGPMDIEVITKNLTTDLNFAEEKPRGKVDVEYAVSLSGMKEAKNRLTIDIM